MTEQVEQWICIILCIRVEYSLWKLFGWFRRLQLWATGDWQLHHDNALDHASHLVQNFFAKLAVTRVTHPPYNPDLAPCNFWLFPKLKSPLKGKRFQNIDEIQKIRWGIWWRLGELCEVPSAYFEGDWGIIALCTMFLASCIFNKCLCFSYYMTGYLLVYTFCFTWFNNSLKSWILRWDGLI